MPKRQYRRRGTDGDDNDKEAEEGTSEETRLCYALEDIRDLQKLRKRKPGLSTEELASSSDRKDVVKNDSDPLDLKTGGLMMLKKLKPADLKDVDIEEDIKQTFSKESYLRDEDEEMRRYVEEELRRKKGITVTGDLEEKKTETPEDGLFALPDKFKQFQSKRNEDMLSNQMLCGIPEVDLGIAAKIKNIEETETTKMRLLKEAQEKQKNLEAATTFRQDIVKDLAKDYVRHQRYDIDQTTDFGRQINPVKRPPTEAVAVVGEDTPSWVQDGRKVERPLQKYNPTKNLKPTDKHVQDKFKKKFVKDKK